MKADIKIIKDQNRSFLQDTNVFGVLFKTHDHTYEAFFEAADMDEFDAQVSVAFARIKSILRDEYEKAKTN